MPQPTTEDRGPPAPPADGPPQPTTDTPTAPAVPGYEIVAELGRGGMGVVYRARHLALKREVALKVILAGGHAGEREGARFRTEAEAAAQLSHPNIVQVHEVGEAGGVLFCAQELVGGGSLARRLAGTPQPPRQVAALVETLARAVHAAHQRGVIHRDLKPDNVLLAEDGAPKVADFGLARRLGGQSGLTQTGQVMGTPSYMAPEQASGRAGEAGPAADVYALGAILYEGLTGRPPFKGPTALDTLSQVLHREPVPPGQLQPVLYAFDQPRRRSGPGHPRQGEQGPRLGDGDGAARRRVRRLSGLLHARRQAGDQRHRLCSELPRPRTAQRQDRPPLRARDAPQRLRPDHRAAPAGGVVRRLLGGVRLGLRRTAVPHPLAVVA
jgi:serine/threonine-protein kinase